MGLRGYAICGERRSGSNYLCRLLDSTGLLGHPIEYFVAEVARIWFPGYPDDPEEQVRRIPRLSATSNGIYGLKLHALEFDRVKPTRWVERLPDLRFVYLERRDVLGQAISFVRASQTSQWASTLSAVAEPTYDRHRINQALLGTLNGMSRWRFYLARNGIDYLHLVYEDVVAAPQAAVDAVARFVGLNEPAPIDPARVGLTIQRDALSENWRQRFIAETGDLARFD